MYLHLDGIIFSLQQHGGITVYFRELLRRFTADHHAKLTIETPLQQPLAAESFPHVRHIERPARRVERMRACRGLDGPMPDVFHSSYYRRPAEPSQPTVVTVHDFVGHRFLRGPRGQMRQWLMNSAIAQAHHIICISEATRQDLMEFAQVRTNQRVSVIHNGVSNLFHPLTSDDQPKPSDKRHYMLFVGQRGGYKNFALALQALEHLPDLTLCCVGGGPLRTEELSCVPEGTRTRVKHLSFVDDQQLNWLYNHAHCLIYPSAYEGFGIPVLEAMRAGCPVVSTHCKAVMEIGGQALSIPEDDTDPMSLAHAVLQLCSHGTRARLRDLGLAQSLHFSWDRCFEQTMEVYHGLCQSFD